MLLKELRSAGLIVAYVGLFFSLLMLIPWITSVLTGWEGGKSFLWSGVLSALLCILVIIACFGDQPKVTPRFGILVVNLLWFLLPILCAIPLFNSSADLSFVDALFEATSGLTTTGSTILTDILTYDRPILLWRALMQWVGGLGILSLGLILLPFLRIGGMQLFRMESSDRSDKPLPRLVEISRSIIIIYVILSMACVVAYLFVGLNPFDALTHAMTSVATGGFSTHDESLGYYKSSSVLWVAIFFMIVGGLPFSVFISIFFTRNSPKLDPQVFTFVMIIIVSAVLLIFYQNNKNTVSFYQNTEYVFNVVSIVTTTGYSSGDFMDYGSLGPAIFFFLIFIGGCAGSTSGGIKIYRFIVLGQVIKTSLRQLIYSKGVFLLRYGNKLVNQEIYRSTVTMICCFFVCLVLVTLSLSLCGLDFITSLSGAATALANVGPGIGDVIGPSGSFQTIDNIEKYILILAMILGRLELLVAMAFFLPMFWKQ
ncbi:TrkH family potassium uptake protein [Paracoccaceae bacterium]|nr:TrkH family potassium uptake protein [Paracoccaceae bacterium]